MTHARVGSTPPHRGEAADTAMGEPVSASPGRGGQRRVAPRRELGRALLASIDGAGVGRDEIHRLLAVPAGLSLVQAARRHGIDGFLRDCARQTPAVHPEVAEALAEAHELAVRSHLRVLVDLAHVKEILDGAGVAWVVIKGPVLAETVYPRFDLRTYRDLDLLVEPAAFPRALEALEAAGSQLYERNWSLLRREMKGQVHLTLPHGTFCDLHWDLLHDREVRDAFVLPTGPLLRRAQRVSLGGLEVPALEEADAFVHLALHACLSGADRLVWLKDLELAARDTQLLWDEVVRRSIQSGTHLTLAAVLTLVSELFDVAVPAEIACELDPRGRWTRLVSLAARLSPPQQASGGGSLLRIVARSTRPTFRASLQELLRRSAGWTRRPLRSSPGARRALQDPTWKGSARYPSGGASDREGYLSALAAIEEATDRRGRGDCS